MKDETPRAESSGGRWSSEDHPAPEKLSAYQAEELPAAEDDAIQEHLANCGVCAEALLDLQRFLDSAPEGRSSKGVADFEAAAEWRELRGKVREVRLRKSLRAFQALAAVLGILFVGLSVYEIHIHGRSSALLAMPEKTLDFSEKRGGQSVREGARLPIALKLFFEADYPRYKLEIQTTQGRLLYSHEYTKLDLDRSALPVPDGFLAPGNYTVRLFGLADGRPEPIGPPIELAILP